MEASWHTVHGVLFFQRSLSQRRNVPSWKVHSSPLGNPSTKMGPGSLTDSIASHERCQFMSVSFMTNDDEWWWMLLKSRNTFFLSCLILFPTVHSSGCGCFSVTSLLVIPGLTPVGWLQLTQPEEHRRTRCLWFFPSYHIIFIPDPRYPSISPWKFTGKTMTRWHPSHQNCTWATPLSAVWWCHHPGWILVEPTFPKWWF